MDIEGPQSPIHSLRDFAIHIATVTIGILIALGLEALVEAHRNHALVEHTRADFVTEFTNNRAALGTDLRKSAALKSELEGLIGYGQAKLAGRPATVPPLRSTRSFAFMATTAWQTAIATQAMIHLPFSEADAIAEAERKQEALNDLQSRAEGQWFELAAFGDPRTVPAAELRPALEKVTIAYAYLISVMNTEQTLVAVYDHALKLVRRP